VGHRAGLDAVVRRKVPSPYREMKKLLPPVVTSDNGYHDCEQQIDHCSYWIKGWIFTRGTARWR
jgi:hypothetical protein